MMRGAWTVGWALVFAVWVDLTQVSAAEARPLEVVRKVEPLYPLQARANGIEGTVRVRFEVDGSGDVAKPKVTSSSGDGFLDLSALMAISQWKFLNAPATGKSKRGKQTVEQDFEFKAPGAKEQEAMCVKLKAMKLPPPPDQLETDLVDRVGVRVRVEFLLALDEQGDVCWLRLLKSSRSLKMDYALAEAFYTRYRYDVKMLGAPGVRAADLQLAKVPAHLHGRIAHLVRLPVEIPK